MQKLDLFWWMHSSKSAGNNLNPCFRPSPFAPSDPSFYTLLRVPRILYVFWDHSPAVWFFSSRLSGAHLREPSGRAAARAGAAAPRAGGLLLEPQSGGAGAAGARLLRPGSKKKRARDGSRSSEGPFVTPKKGSESSGPSWVFYTFLLSHGFRATLRRQAANTLMREGSHRNKLVPLF